MTPVMRCNQYASPLVRFEASYMPEPMSGCWLWIAAAAAGRDPRPRLNIDGKPCIAYRFAWEAFRGPIPPGAFVCHKCDVSICVNPDHLYIGDAKTNAADALSRGRHTSQRYPGATVEAAKRAGHANAGRFHRRKTAIPHDEVLARIAAGEGPSSIARSAGVTAQAITALVKRERRRATISRAEGR